MKKKFLTIFSVSILATLLLPFSVLGAVVYERTPAGTSIENPVSFRVSFDELSEICATSTTNYWTLYWKEWWEAGDREVWSIFDDIIPITIKDHTFTGNLPLTEFSQIAISCCSTEYDASCNSAGDLEGDDSEVIFEVIETPVVPVGVIQAGFDENLPDYDMASTTAHIGGLINSTGGLIWLAIGIPLGFYVITQMIKLFDLVIQDKRRTAWWKTHEEGDKEPKRF